MRVMSGVLPSTSEKPRYVAAMFGRIAHRYDLMNTLMSMGQDAGWRQALVDVVGTSGAPRVLDVGTGTGLVALEIARQVPGARVVGADFTDAMLRAGRPRLAQEEAGQRVALVGGDGLHLPFPDATFDAVVSAFVVRNLADVRAGLREQARVLRPGGRLAVLEITPGPRGWMGWLFRLYFRGLVPLVGKLVAGDATAYTYLPESAAAFLEPEQLAELAREAGITRPQVRRLSLGAVALTQGVRGEGTAGH